MEFAPGYWNKRRPNRELFGSSGCGLVRECVNFDGEALGLGNEIRCNELVLLAYYIADVNIERVFHSLTQRKTYLPYNGICLTDTFELNEEGENDIF